MKYNLNRLSLYNICRGIITILISSSMKLLIHSLDLLFSFLIHKYKHHAYPFLSYIHHLEQSILVDVLPFCSGYHFPWVRLRTTWGLSWHVSRAVGHTSALQS